MIKIHDLSELDWKLTGWHPNSWRMKDAKGVAFGKDSDIKAVECKLPCSVQKALLDAGIIDDWNVANNYRNSEWIEHRHWIFTSFIPKDWIKNGKKYILKCDGLDYSGEIYINDVLVYDFQNAYINHEVDLTEALNKALESDDIIFRIAFKEAPYWQGCFGKTTEMTTGKPRYYYTWDWTCRVVQTGIWDSIRIVELEKEEIDYIDIDTNVDLNSVNKGSLDVTGYMTGDTQGTALIELLDEGFVVKSENVILSDNSFSVNWHDLDIKLWYPNGNGDQKLYELTISITDSDGKIIDEDIKRIGFKHISWELTAGAPVDSTKWLCVVNGTPTFIQGFNWVPPKNNFADVIFEDYKVLIDIYKDLGVNILRVWGGAVLEREVFYNLCDEAGIMVWQEFPVSSSGLENYPPEDSKIIDMLSQVATSYIKRRKHHASLLMWCGGNELFTVQDNFGIPCGTEHPLLGKFKEIVNRLDHNRHFIPASPTGPRMYCDLNNVGKGLHQNTHGPWKAAGTVEEWNDLFDREDSMFRAETGAPGCSDIEILKAYSGDLQPYPITAENDYWARPMCWWVEVDDYKREVGRYPKTMEEYVAWSQQRQADLLVKAVGSCKSKFPKCGGFIIWMGHDNYPCPGNTSVIDYHRNLKPAAIALKEKVFRKN